MKAEIHHYHHFPGMERLAGAAMLGPFGGLLLWLALAKKVMRDDH